MCCFDQTHIAPIVEYVAEFKEKTREIALIPALRPDGLQAGSSRWVKLVTNAKTLFESSEPEEKRLLLKMSLQNLMLEGKKVRYEWVNPFDKVALYASRSAWLRTLNEIRTFFSENPNAEF